VRGKVVRGPLPSQGESGPSGDGATTWFSSTQGLKADQAGHRSRRILSTHSSVCGSRPFQAFCSPMGSTRISPFHSFRFELRIIRFPV